MHPGSLLLDLANELLVSVNTDFRESLASDEIRFVAGIDAFGAE